jgi:hypothetical protein
VVTGIRLTILGPVRAWRGDAELDVGPPQQRAMLALLVALRGGGEPVSEELIDDMRESARATIAKFLHRGELEFVGDFAVPFSAGSLARQDEFVGTVTGEIDGLPLTNEERRAITTTLFLGDSDTTRSMMLGFARTLVAVAFEELLVVATNFRLKPGTDRPRYMGPLLSSPPVLPLEFDRLESAQADQQATGQEA